ncbi:hypothetical protein ACWDX6_30500 [Streptomyces sp. NPDC003027]
MTVGTFALILCVALVGALPALETARQPLEGSPPSVETEEEAAELVLAQAPEPKF